MSRINHADGVTVSDPSVKQEADGATSAAQERNGSDNKKFSDDVQTRVLMALEGEANYYKTTIHKKDVALIHSDYPEITLETLDHKILNIIGKFVESQIDNHPGRNTFYIPQNLFLKTLGWESSNYPVIYKSLNKLFDAEIRVNILGKNKKVQMAYKTRYITTLGEDKENGIVIVAVSDFMRGILSHHKQITDKNQNPIEIEGFVSPNYIKKIYAPIDIIEQNKFNYHELKLLEHFMSELFRNKKKEITTEWYIILILRTITGHETTLKENTEYIRNFKKIIKKVNEVSNINIEIIDTMHTPSKGRPRVNAFKFFIKFKTITDKIQNLISEENTDEDMQLSFLDPTKEIKANITNAEDAEIVIEAKPSTYIIEKLSTKQANQETISKIIDDVTQDHTNINLVIIYQYIIETIKYIDRQKTPPKNYIGYLRKALKDNYINFDFFNETFYVNEKKYHIKR